MDNINISTAVDIFAAKANDQGNTSDRRIHNGIENDQEMKIKEFSVGLIEAKTWSNMIQDKIPKIIPRTPIRTPPGEPETINTWELMAGLEEEDNFSLPHRFRSFSFDLSRDPSPVQDSPRMNPTLSPNKIQINNKPFWLQLADKDASSKCLELDPQVMSTFRKSFQDLSPNHPFYLKPSEDIEKQQEEQSLPSDATDIVIKDYCKGGKEKLVVYFTSLRGVRKTYEDCCHVRVILKGLGVRVDERDMSMHSGFKDELKELLGEAYSSGGLPRVFIGRKYIGGAEEIRRMHEEGQLEKAVEECEMLEDDSSGGGGACESCGDIRFVPCETCNGSCKIYYEPDEEEGEEEEEAAAAQAAEKELEEEEEEEGEYGFQRCPDCNENGLIRCPICCY